MKKTPKITIVTITFNLLKAGREETFKQCVKSVHSQTYKNIEHIVIDGASTDGTIKMLEEYQKKGWFKYYSEPDKGIYDAMNKGLKKATGEYIAFLNSDDFYHKNDGVEKTVNILMKNGADYCIGDVMGIDSQNEKNKNIWHGRLDLLALGCGYCHQSMFVKTSILQDYGGFDCSYKICADSDMMLHLYADKKKVVINPYCFASYRSGGISCTNSQLTRTEHSSVYYKYVGKKIGLSQKDCYNLWNFSCINELENKDMLNLAEKVKSEPYFPELMIRFARKIIDMPSNTRKIIEYKLFGFLPVLKWKIKDNKTKIYVLGMLILKITK